MGEVGERFAGLGVQFLEMARPRSAELSRVRSFLLLLLSRLRTSCASVCRWRLLSRLRVFLEWCCAASKLWMGWLMLRLPPVVPLLRLRPALELDVTELATEPGPRRRVGQW